MTRVDVQLSELPDLVWDEGTVPVLMFNPWGIFPGARDVVARPDETGLVSAHLVPTPVGAFYSVQVSWAEDGMPRSRFLEIRVPEVAPTPLLDLVGGADDASEFQSAGFRGLGLGHRDGT